MYTHLHSHELVRGDYGGEQPCTRKVLGLVNLFRLKKTWLIHVLIFSTAFFIVIADI